MVKNNFQKVGVAVIWCGKKILLSERLKKGAYKGYYGATGGKIEKNEDIVDGTVREVYEEAGCYIYDGSLRLIDCFILHKHRKKVFIFEAVQETIFFDKVKDVEPEKHSPWKLYSKKEALELNLMPYLRLYLNSVEPNKLKKIF